VKRKACLAACFVAALGLASLLSPPHRPTTPKGAAYSGVLQAQENVPAQKPSFDYMSTFLSRNTKPLGLEEDKEVKKLKQQPVIKWAVRSSLRHSLQ
jgi:hypothetical protein